MWVNNDTDRRFRGKIDIAASLIGIKDIADLTVSCYCFADFSGFVTSLAVPAGDAAVNAVGSLANAAAFIGFIARAFALSVVRITILAARAADVFAAVYCLAGVAAADFIRTAVRSRNAFDALPVSRADRRASRTGNFSVRTIRSLALVFVKDFSRRTFARPGIGIATLPARAINPGA